MKAEFLTPPGVLNAIWMFAAFVLVSVAGALDLYQALIRSVYKPHYEAGSPSFLWLLVIFSGLSFVCIAIVAVFTTRPRR